MKLLPALAVVLLLTPPCQRTDALVPFGMPRTTSITSLEKRRTCPSSLFALKEDSLAMTQEEAERLLKEAKLMRLQADKMDMKLTMEKIDALETKLNNKSWLEKNPELEADLRQQLQRLQDKLEGGSTNSAPAVPSAKNVATPSPTSMPSPRSESSKSSTFVSAATSKKRPIPNPPYAGFDDSDLELYIPIALEIQNMTDNLDEQLTAFRTAPELQSHFQEKIQKMLMTPLEDIAKLEAIKQQYINSSSRVEREHLKRQINQLEESLDESGPFIYSDGFFCEDLKPMSDEELQQRMEAVGGLPPLMQAIYKQRAGLDEVSDLKLAIEMDYYEPQLQILQQVYFFNPLSDDQKEAFTKGYESLPKSVRDHMCEKNEIPPGSDAMKLVEAMLGTESAMTPFMQVVEAGSMSSGQSPEYDDIEYLDRSRFLEKTFPSIANMGGRQLSLELVQQFCSDVIPKKAFMVESKPELVAGGFYIRGSNLLNDEEDSSGSVTISAADKLVKEISKRLEASNLKDALEFFYILDPAGLLDEDIELGESVQPLLLVIAKDPADLYKMAKPLTKLGVTASGLLSAFMFSIGACALNPSINERLMAELDATPSTGTVDITWFSELAFPLFASLLLIQVVHELAHRVVASIYKTDIGLPNVIPSIITGLTGGITPLKNPLPNAKALFDFAVAGPLAGLLVSVVLLVYGLDLAATMDVQPQFPVIPTDLLRSSSLGGGLVEVFLGKGLLLPNPNPGAVLQLHPLAISGFLGALINALALLPLGRTDGGRIAVAMFGRKGAYVVTLFTTLLLCLAGLFGLDESNMLLVYLLYASIWQRDLEIPCRNEVDELDFPRGLLGIFAALVVGLVLIPMF